MCASGCKQVVDGPGVTTCFFVVLGVLHLRVLATWSAACGPVLATFRMPVKILIEVYILPLDCSIRLLQKAVCWKSFSNADA